GHPATDAEDSVFLEYDIVVQQAGPATLALYLVPTLDVAGHHGARIGVSIDNRPVQILRASLEATGGDQNSEAKKR
ncbi:hypothetical protein, partial [Klebsiella pneumoniae]